MARFGVYSSDSSEDEDIAADEPAQKEVGLAVTSEESEEESDEESSSSSSESDLDVDDLRRDGDDVEKEKSPPVQFVDKTLIPRAHAIGMDAQRMHVMQTSFFRMPEEAAALQTLNQPKTPLNRKHSRDSDGEGLRTDPKERASFAYDIQLPAHRPSRKFARVESSISAFVGNEHTLVDAGLALGRSFRVGWGPGGALVHLGSLVSPSGSPLHSANSSVIHKTSINTYSTPNSLSLKLLQHHLSNSPIRPDDDGVPFANPSPTDLQFSSFVSLFASTDQSPEAILFRLGQALFDPVDLRLAKTITADIRNRILSVARRAALSTWLQQTVIPTIDSEIKANPSMPLPLIAFTLLTANQLEKACDIVMDSGYLKLATLISQAGGDFDFKEDVHDQLNIWREQRIDAHIDENIRKIYALLAGKVDGPLEGSKGLEPERCKDVDVVENLDWKRVFGLCLWYSEPIDASIAQVFQSYTELTKIPGRNVARPIPWYAERKRTPPSLQWKLPPEASLPADGLYTLIRLYSDPACSLSHILNPLSFSPSPVDYSLPWHLYIILSRCLRVRDFADRGDTGIDQDEQEEEEATFEGHSPTADLLTSSYASQLEQLGLIQEALFVLLHIEGSVGREKAIKDLLTRSAPLLDEWMVRGIVGSLKIPIKWVYEAQALLAMRNEDMYTAYELYITAGLHDPAHDIAVQHLAADAVIRHDFDLLGTIFSRFVGRNVNGWHVRGKVFMDYVDIMTRLPELIAEQDPTAVPDASQESQIEELLRAIPKVIGLVPDIFTDRLDIRHKVALNEMTSSLVKLMDRIRPLALSQTKISLVDEISKLHIQSTAVGRFLKSIQGS